MLLSLGVAVDSDQSHHKLATQSNLIPTMAHPELDPELMSGVEWPNRSEFNHCVARETKDRETIRGENLPLSPHEVNVSRILEPNPTPSWPALLKDAC